MIRKRIGLYSLIGCCIFMIGILSRIFGEAQKSQMQPESAQQRYFAIVPHFAIQPETIETFYQFLQTTYSIDAQEPVNIVLISPDHFDASSDNIDMLCEDSQRFCYQETCVTAKKLPATKTSGCLDKSITKEHGLGEAFPFIQEFFPKAKIFPIVVKPRKFVDDTQLIKMLQDYEFAGKTLVLASVDFSHYVDEDFAKLHDAKSFYTLNNAKSISEYGSLEVDCPSCLYITNTLAQQNKHYPKLFLRDSSSAIAGKNLGTGNTSRQFIYYTDQKQEKNGFTIAFFGDLMFDRQVATTLSAEDKIKEQFKTFFQNEDVNLPLSSSPHRKLFGIDFVGLNLETPVVSDKTICKPSGKEITFCSSDIILPHLKNIGFTLMNMANNHSLDGGTQAHVETVQHIRNNGLNYIGWIRNGPYFEKNYAYKTNVRGIKVAWEGCDFTTTPRGMFSGYCTALQRNKTEGYINVVSVHRGTEYQSTHNADQESLGRQLIDCGADIIIGHHPHVIQDIGRYQGKPIIYSLGNFLFDMHTPDTETGAYVLIDYQSTNKRFIVMTGNISADIK